MLTYSRSTATSVVWTLLVFFFKDSKKATEEIFLKVKINKKKTNNNQSYIITKNQHFLSVIFIRYSPNIYIYIKREKQTETEREKEREKKKQTDRHIKCERVNERVEERERESWGKKDRESYILPWLSSKMRLCIATKQFQKVLFCIL